MMGSQQRRKARRIEASWAHKDLHDKTKYLFSFQVMLSTFVIMLCLFATSGLNFDTLSFVKTSPLWHAVRMTCTMFVVIAILSLFYYRWISPHVGILWCLVFPQNRKMP
jgi:hypothetical protein